MTDKLVFDEGSTYDLKQAEGILRVFLQDPETKQIVDHRVVRNVITYNAADVMAKAVVGDSQFQLSHIYFQHNTTAVFPTEGVVVATATRDDDITNLTDGPSVTTNAEVPILTRGFAASPEVPGRYNHNIVTVTAVAGSDLLNNQMFIGAGLVARVGNTDILFAHQYFPTLLKLPQFQVVGAWSVRFL